LVAIALVAVLLGAQALAAGAAPEGGRSETGRVLGKTGFAFLGGLRTFGAAVLWNRVDPVFHEYYSGVTLKEQLFALPTMQLVTILDPQFIQAYYVASFTLMERGEEEVALRIAREGVANNPDSGLMLANLAQLLMMEDRDKNLPEMVALAESGLSDQAQWSNADDLFEGLVIFRSVYAVAGDESMAERLRVAVEELHDSGQLTDHDHDHDGVQDH
jgi:surface antigen